MEDEMHISTDTPTVQKMVGALPFADSDAGLAETGRLICLLHNERNDLYEALSKLSDSLSIRAVDELPMSTLAKVEEALAFSRENQQPKQPT